MVFWGLPPMCISVNCTTIHPGLSWDPCGLGLHKFRLVHLWLRMVTLHLKGLKCSSVVAFRSVGERGIVCITESQIVFPRLLRNLPNRQLESWSTFNANVAWSILSSFQGTLETLCPGGSSSVALFLLSEKMSSAMNLSILFKWQVRRPRT